LARPPKDANPVASTGGVANSQGQAIFTGDWNALITDYLSQTDSTAQTIKSPLTIRPSSGSIEVDILDSDSNHGLQLVSSGPRIHATLLSSDIAQANLMEWGDELSNSGLLLGMSRNLLQIYLGGNPSLGFTTFFLSDDPSGSPPGNFNVQSGAGTGLSSNLLGNGAQVGLPAGSAGAVPNTMCLGGHRHPFSGRFLHSGYLRLPIATGGAFPKKFSRFTIANNWTLRRLEVYAQSAPNGNETYGVVNAAGTLQGSGLTLANAAVEAGATQTTNLTGGTTYYLAQTASAASTPSTDVNMTMEYTMNV
jgi:hypothetical protein